MYRLSAASVSNRACTVIRVSDQGYGFTLINNEILGLQQIGAEKIFKSESRIH